MLEDKEKDKIEELDDEQSKDSKAKNDDKYFVPEEAIETVFQKNPEQKIKVDEPEEEIPQEKANYQVQPQLVSESKNGLAPRSITSEMRKSFLEYAMSVIVARALPDARDGLKPVHRRILYGMHELGLTHQAPHKKSARIVGDVLGKYHPHSDSSVYEAMVRLSQDFSMRYPMVDGHGNFGSIDGDGAAAMRYTEARMSKIASAMVKSIRKETVDFMPNYDGSEQEPVVLPARIPNLLVSGTTGIAVGMATSIPSHNLNEVINGVIALAQKPAIQIKELMTYIPGPDFPTGGIILGAKGIANAYETGKGSVKIRSLTHIEALKNGKHRIVVTEIPFLVNKANMIEKIAHLVKDKAIEGITDLRDETSRKGIRIVIELKRDVVPEVVQNQLFKMSQLQMSFSINMLALVKNKPRVLNLKEALKVYLDHQIEVVTRRTQFDLNKAEAKAHILEGLKIATSNIDKVIKIIRSSKTDEIAQETLRKTFKLSIKQVKAITDMRLGRLTGLAIEKMDLEIETLTMEIKHLKRILHHKNELLGVIIQELTEFKERFGDARRTSINHSLGDIEDEDLIPQKSIAITMSSRGYVKRIPLIEYQVQNRGGIGSKAMSTYEDDDVEKIVTTTTHTDLLIFTTYGKVYRIRAHQIPELSKQAKGIPFINLIDIQKDEKIISLLTVDTYDKGHFLVTITKKGIIKKTVIEEYSRINRNGKIALKMREDDMLVNAMIATDEDEIVIGASHGKMIRFNASDVRAMGRTATGVKGLEVDNSKAQVVGASLTRDGKGFILAIGDDGFGKMTAVKEYRKTRRGAKGVTTLDTKKAGYLKFVRVVKGNEDILIITKKGIIIRTSLKQVSCTSRSTKGVKIIRLQQDNKIKSIDVIDVETLDHEVEEAIRLTQEVNLKEEANFNQTLESNQENTDEDDDI